MSKSKEEIKKSEKWILTPPLKVIAIFLMAFLLFASFKVGEQFGERKTEINCNKKIVNMLARDYSETYCWICSDNTIYFYNLSSGELSFTGYYEKKNYTYGRMRKVIATDLPQGYVLAISFFCYEDLRIINSENKEIPRC